jgi:hypothetical protein
VSTFAAMKFPRVAVLLLLTAFIYSAGADKKVELSADDYDSGSSSSYSGDIHTITVTSKKFAGNVRRLQKEETARLRVEWESAGSGWLDHWDQAEPQTKLWEPAKKGEWSSQIGVRGRLLLASADGKTSEPVTWQQPVRVIVERRPDSTPDWSQHHTDSTTATGDTRVEPDGTFLAVFSAAELRRVPGKAVAFRTGLCLGTHEGRTIKWTGETPVLTQSLTKLSISGPPVLSRIQKLINAAPSPAGHNFDPAALIRAVNALHELGKDKALSELREFLKYAGWGGFHERIPEDISTADSQCVFGIVMLLFESDSPQHPVPNPALGGPSPSPEQDDWNHWPLYPFALVNDVPFSLAQGFTLAGLPSQPISHIKWAEAHGKLRARPLHPASDPLAAAAKLLATPQGQRLFGTSFKDHYYSLPINQALAAARPHIELPQDGDKGFDDKDWVNCQRQATELKLAWDAGALKWVCGAK